MPNEAPNPTLSPEEVAKVHALAAERRQRRERERQAKALSDQNFAKREAERRLLASLEGSDNESTAAATAARQKAAEKAKADLASRARAVEATRIAEANAIQTAAVAAETDRARGLARVALQAAKLGVPFDLVAAIKGKVSASAAREAVMNAAADADDTDVMFTGYSLSETEIANHERGARHGDSMAGGWNSALERAASRAGLPAFPPTARGGPAEGDANHFYSQSRPAGNGFGS